MRKIIIFIVIVMAIASSAFAKHERDNYRLGLGIGVISPTSNISLNKQATLSYNLEIDAKLTEIWDLTTRYSFINAKTKTTSFDADYGVSKLGFGGRLYLSPFGADNNPQATHGLANIYLDGAVDYYQATKLSEVMANSPVEFSGFGAYLGVGIEGAVGIFAGYLSGGYQRTSIKSSSNLELPLDGYLLQAGLRMSFVK